MELKVFGPFNLSFLEDGRLKIQMRDTNEGALVSQSRQEELIDYLLQGYKDNLHKGATSDQVERIWTRIEQKIEAIANNATIDELTEIEKAFKRECLSAATKELQQRCYANAAKILEMYDSF